LKIKYELYLKEVTNAYLKAGKPLSKIDHDFQKGRLYKTHYKLHNVSRENFKKLEKKSFSFSDLDFLEQSKIWSYIFKNTDYMGVGHLGINFHKKFQKKKNFELCQFWPELKTWISKIENWAHGDMIASLYSQMLEENYSLVYPTLLIWSKSKSPWKKRMALVSLFYYFHCRKTFPPFKKVIAILRPQMSIEHYYLQKAVGWTLRELTQAYPEETAAFMDKELNAISSTAFSASVEKIEKSRKELLKKRRKEYRQKHKI
jgi:3-methyladenine DNA glycosylase AlkD